MKHLPAAFVAIMLCQPAWAGEISSAYTDIDTAKTCSVLSADDEAGDSATFTCKGWNEYPVTIDTGDLRESVFYGFPPDGDRPWESFSAFNSTGPKIEWRIETEGSRAIAFATIHRWFVNADPEDPAKQTQVLVVAKVASRDERKGCTVGLVLASGNPKANEMARAIADEHARTFVCGRDDLVSAGGPLPDFSRSAD